MILQGIKTIDIVKLERWTDEGRSFALINVLPEGEGDAYSCGIPVSCMREKDFLDQIKALRIKKSHPVVLYASRLGTIPTEKAAEILMHEGFHEVYCFVGPQSALHVSQHAHA